MLNIPKDGANYIKKFHSQELQEIKEVIQKLDMLNVQSVILYDRYSGKSIPKNKVSLSLRFIFQHPQRTLLAEEVDIFLEKIIKALKSSFKLQLREGGEN